MRIAVIGAGLAGSTCAYVLSQAGHDVVVYEACDDVASEASGNVFGMYNPRISALKDKYGIFYETAFNKAKSLFGELPDIDMLRCGSVHLAVDERRKVKYHKACENWEWGADKMRMVTADEASDIAGVEIEHDALYLSEAGCVSPEKLCPTLLKDIDVRCSSRVTSLQIEDVDKVVLACARGLASFKLGINLELQFVRGQVTRVGATDLSSGLKTNLCYGGYCTPRTGDEHVVGATFQPWINHSDILPEDDKRNLSNLRDVAPALAKGFSVTGHRASVRVASRDRFPIVGQVANDVYVSSAHGSHGVVSSVMAAELIAEMINEKVSCLPQETVDALSPRRFS